MRLNSADRFMWEVLVHNDSSKGNLARFHVLAQNKAQATTVLKEKPFFKEWSERRSGYVIAMVKRAPALGGILKEGLLN